MTNNRLRREKMHRSAKGTETLVRPSVPRGHSWTRKHAGTFDADVTPPEDTAGTFACVLHRQDDPPHSRARSNLLLTC